MDGSLIGQESDNSQNFKNGSGNFSESFLEGGFEHYSTNNLRNLSTIPKEDAADIGDRLALVMTGLHELRVLSLAKNNGIWTQKLR